MDNWGVGTRRFETTSFSVPTIIELRACVDVQARPVCNRTVRHVRTGEAILEQSRKVRMPYHIYIGINDCGKVNKTLNLAALFLAAPVPVRTENCVGNLPPVMLRYAVSSEPEEDQRGGW